MRNIYRCSERRQLAKKRSKAIKGRKNETIERMLIIVTWKYNQYLLHTHFRKLKHCDQNWLKSISIAEHHTLGNRLNIPFKNGVCARLHRPTLLLWARHMPLHTWGSPGPPPLVPSIMRLDLSQERNSCQVTASAHSLILFFLSVVPARDPVGSVIY